MGHARGRCRGGRLHFRQRDRSLYVIGGEGPNGVSNSVFRYSGGTSWTTCASAPYASRNSGVFALGSYLYSVGGESGSLAQTHADRYDGSSWTAVSNLPGGRRDFACGVLGSYAYVIGGADSGGGSVDTVSRFDGTNWSTATSLPAARYCHYGARLGNALYVMGGLVGGGQATNILKFDGTTWTQVGYMPRWVYQPAVCVESNRIVLAGGMNSSYSSITNIIAFDGTNWTERLGLNSVVDRAGAGVVSNRLYIVGGYSTPVTETRYYRVGSTGVTPVYGLKTGGFTVTIMGTGLGNGSDITNVTLCGAKATIQAGQKATQVVVTAGASYYQGLGDVCVYSTSQGVTVKSNYFTYEGPVLGLYVDDTWSIRIASGSAASVTSRTDFGKVNTGVVTARTFAISEDSNVMGIHITNVQVTGSGAAAFSVSNVPPMLEAYGYSNIVVRFSAPLAPGVYTATVKFASDGVTNPYLFNLSGTAVTTVPLRVQSAYGVGAPPAGVYTNLTTTVLTNSVSAIDTRGTTQYVCAGWVMTGNEPASGADTQVVMTVTNSAVLTWLWRTNYWLDTAAGLHGSVDADDGWQPFGVTTSITATADRYYHFTNWTGGASGSANPLNLLMNSPKTVMANFAQNMTTSSPLPVPEEWMAGYGLMDFETDVNADPDHDGQFTWEEYIAAETDPTNPASFFRTTVANGSLLISWPSASGRLYNVDATLNVRGSDWTATGWTNLSATPPMNTVTNPSSAMTNAAQFFRARARME